MLSKELTPYTPPDSMYVSNLQMEKPRTMGKALSRPPRPAGRIAIAIQDLDTIRPGFDTKLREQGQQQVADKIQQYLSLRAEEEDEAPVVPDSLGDLVDFLLRNSSLLPPSVGANPQGLMEIEWHLADSGDSDTVWGRGNGVVSMRFITAGAIQFVALSGPYRYGQDRLKKQGKSDFDGIMASLGEFAPRIMSE